MAVLGDWNGFYFEEAQTQLTDPAKGGVLTNLNTLLSPEERYSYLFGGNAQQIDNILVTGGWSPTPSMTRFTSIRSSARIVRPITIRNWRC